MPLRARINLLAEDPKKILAMSDDELQAWALSGDVGSYVHELGETAMSMRCSLRMVEASKEMANANKDLVGSTSSLVRQTRHLVIATWGLVLITVFAQIAVIVIALVKKWR
jgi:t-SNARE complex subunit (syntaxin)